ncbi:MAG: arginase family protein [Gammaproteobacteria bacterium]|nr:arginase family protein [Gammaproteobacteria bacterium]
MSVPGGADAVFDGETFRRTGTFMNIPHSLDLGQSRAAILGIPFDCGEHPVRLGARLGPAAIREQSALVRRHQPPLWDVDPLQALGVVDCGDVDVVLGDIMETFRRIEAAVGHIVDADAVPITFGGDGAVTLPQLRAVHRRHADLVVLHFDAHTDTYPDEQPATGTEGSRGGNYKPYSPSTTFSRAAEEGVVDAAASLHVGARGTVRQPGVFEHTREKGFGLVTGIDLMQRGIDDVLAGIHARMAGRPVYLCWDMDFFDPSCAPGVFTPTWGGVSAREGLALLQGLAGLDIVATDVNTLSPLHDVGGMSAFLAATCVIECVHLVRVALERRAQGTCQGIRREI